MRDKAVDNRAECALPASAFSGNDNKFSFFYSCGGFYTPALCAVIKGIKTDCNHLIEHTVRNIEHCAPTLASGLLIELSFCSSHKTIPVGAKTYQSDVESSHRLIEDEFYACRSFAGAQDFFKKAHQYQKHFNFTQV